MLSIAKVRLFYSLLYWILVRTFYEFAQIAMFSFMPQLSRKWEMVAYTATRPMIVKVLCPIQLRRKHALAKLPGIPVL